jgi:ABC-type Fe3+ transport system substrate-binding protein
VSLAYNVLGSYARARAEAGAPITIVQPEDYTLVMSRVAAIPRAARNATLAKAFLDYLLSDGGQAVVAGPSRLQAILPASEQPQPTRAGSDHPIELGPSLLVFLDPMKRKRFLDDWWTAANLP